MKLKEIVSECYDFLFLFENNNYSFKIVNTNELLSGYYIINGYEFVAKIEFGYINIDNNPIQFLNCAFGEVLNGVINYTLTNNPNVNPHAVLGGFAQFIKDHLHKFSNFDVIVFAATNTNHISSPKYPTSEEEINKRIKVYNLLARQISREGYWGIMAENIKIPNGLATLITTKNIEHVNVKTILKKLTNLGKI